MALTRSALREKGITEKEILDYIMDEHGNTVEAAKEKAKETAESTMQKTIDTLQAKVDSLPAPDGEDWKAKYDAEVTAHTKTKTEHETEKSTAAKTTKLEGLLVKAGAHPKYAAKIAKEFKLDDLKDDGDGFKDFDKLVEPVKAEWADMFGTTKTEAYKPAASNVTTGDDDYVAQLKAAREANDTELAVRIKTEAAQENIFLI